MAASGWGTAGLIETDNAGGASSPQVAVDGSGNAVAVWTQSDGTRNNIWANRYVEGTGWGTAGLIETDNAGSAISPEVALDGSGNAVAVWYQYDGTRYNIWANRYVAGTGWGTAGLIETDNAGFAISPQVAVEGSGNAVAVWYQSDGTRFNIWANRYVAGTGWVTAGLIETDNAGAAYGPQVAADGSGNAVVVWYQYDGTRYNIWANRYVAGTGWGTAGLIETDNAGGALDPQVALDGSGNAVAVWYQYDGTRYNIWANRYVAGTGWGTAGLIETDNAGGALDPQVAVDGSGNAVAVWTQSDGTRNNIWANLYVAGTGWATAGLIETDAGGAGSPEVAVDGSGNAVAVWYQSDGTRTNVWANRYVAGTGWGTAGLIETDNAGSAAFPQVAVDGGGSAVAVWPQNDGTRNNIWANRLVEGYPPALSLSSPTDGFSTNRSTVWVGGVTEPGATVSVNGVAVSVASNGSFGILLALAPGTNLIDTTAWDRAGNRASISRNVTFNDPLPALEQGLADAQANLAAAQANLATTQSDLATTQSELATAEADLIDAETRVTALETNASAMQTGLAAAQASLTAAQALVATLETDANATQAELLGAHANLTAAQASVQALETDAIATRGELAAAQTNLTASQARVSTLEASVASTQAALAASQARQSALEANATTAKADLADAQSRITALEANKTAAPADNMLAILAMALGVGGLAVGAAALARAGRGPKAPPSATPPIDPPPRP